jgi:hypothetical protein
MGDPIRWDRGRERKRDLWERKRCFGRRGDRIFTFRGWRFKRVRRSHTLGGRGRAIVIIPRSFPNFRTLVLEPNFDFSRSPVKLLGDAGTNFKRGEGVDWKSTAKNRNLFTSRSLPFFVDILNTEVDGLTSERRFHLIPTSSNSLGSLKGFVLGGGHVHAFWSLVTEAQEPRDTFH